MRILAHVVVCSCFGVLPLVACGIQPSIGTGDDAPADPAATTITTSTTSAPATGVDCGSDPTSGASLCLGISTCPRFLLDRDAFPSCGFRINGAVLDLECVCDGLLCPIGIATTCAQVTPLLANQTPLQVCQQVNDGRCTRAAIKGDAGDAGATPSSPVPSSSCDRLCQRECAGVPGCIQLCGC